MAILASDWVFDSKIIGLGENHLAVRCFLAAVGAANPDGTIGPVTPEFVSMRLLPGAVSVAGFAVAVGAWRMIVDAGLVVEYGDDQGRVFAFFPGWFNVNRAGDNVRKGAKSPIVPDELLSRHPRFLAGYSKCAASVRARLTTYGDYYEIPESRNSEITEKRNCCSSPSPFPSPSPSPKQTSKHPEGWLAGWLHVDPDSKIGSEDRALVERAHAHLGGNGVQPETIARIARAFDRDAAIARKVIAGALEKTGGKPIGNFGRWVERGVAAEIRSRTASE